MSALYWCSVTVHVLAAMVWLGGLFFLGLVVTGAANLRFRGLLRWDGALGSTTFWTSPLGQALAVKLAAALVIVALSAVHDFLIGPASSRAAVGSPEAARYRLFASISGRTTALLGLILVIAAVRVARGG